MCFGSNAVLMERMRSRFSGAVAPRKYGRFATPMPVLAGGEPSQGVRVVVNSGHVLVEVVLPLSVGALSANHAQVYVSVACVPECDHLHAGLLLGLVDELDEVSGAVYRHYEVNRLLLADRLHSLDETAAHLPDVRRGLRVARG